MKCQWFLLRYQVVLTADNGTQQRKCFIPPRAQWSLGFVFSWDKPINQILITIGWQTFWIAHMLPDAQMKIYLTSLPLVVFLCNIRCFAFVLHWVFIIMCVCVGQFNRLTKTHSNEVSLEHVTSFTLQVVSEHVDKVVLVLYKLLIPAWCSELCKHTSHYLWLNLRLFSRAKSNSEDR